jgi:hypothetical protein
MKQPRRRISDRDYRLPLALIGVAAYGLACWWVVERLFPL